jgi:hypothetical protein
MEVKRRSCMDMFLPADHLNAGIGSETVGWSVQVKKGNDLVRGIDAADFR